MSKTDTITNLVEFSVYLRKDPQSKYEFLTLLVEDDGRHSCLDIKSSSGGDMTLGRVRSLL